MPNFAASFSKSTGNCDNLTITDTSNYNDNTDGVAVTDFYSRVFTVRDGIGNTLATYTIPTGTNSVVFPLTGLLSPSFLYLSITMNLFGPSSHQITVGSLLPCILP